MLVAAVRELGATLVLVTHDPRASRIADRVVRIRDGRLSEQWDPATPHSETLVVDDRGWVRLPDALRHGAGAVAGAVAVATADGVLLRGTGRSGHGSRRRRAHRSTSCGEVVARLDAVSVAHGGTTVLDGVALDVHAATLTVVSGRSGLGEVHAAAGADRARAGRRRARSRCSGAGSPTSTATAAPRYAVPAWPSRRRAGRSWRRCT